LSQWHQGRRDWGLHCNSTLFVQLVLQGNILHLQSLDKGGKAVNPDIDWRQMKVTMKEGSEPLVMCSVMEEPGVTPDYVQLYPEVFSEEGFDNLPLR
jgi:hypothetical protein